jgi:hypothetical protein
MDKNHIHYHKYLKYKKKYLELSNKYSKGLFNKEFKKNLTTLIRNQGVCTSNNTFNNLYDLLEYTEYNDEEGLDIVIEFF